MNARDQFLSPASILHEGGRKHEPIRFRTIWISDVHLGTTGCQAERLLEFLRATESKKLYLVGDIIDGWQLKRRWYWDQTHNNVVQTVLKKAKKGTKVIFVPGNHDESISISAASRSATRWFISPRRASVCWCCMATASTA